MALLRHQCPFRSRQRYSAKAAVCVEIEEDIECLGIGVGSKTAWRGTRSTWEATITATTKVTRKAVWDRRIYIHTHWSGPVFGLARSSWRLLRPSRCICIYSGSLRSQHIYIYRWSPPSQEPSIAGLFGFMMVC